MDIVNFIKIASPAFTEPAPVKTGGAGLLCFSQRLNCRRTDFVLEN
jgi:hypothetical protein